MSCTFSSRNRAGQPWACPGHPSFASADNLIIKIAPIGIILDDEIDFPLSRPMFDVLLALKGRLDRVMRFKIDKHLDAVAFGKAIRQALTVLVNSPYQIVRHADVKRPTRFARENVHPVGHFALMDCRAFAAPKGLRPRRRVKPAHDEFKSRPPETVTSHSPPSRSPGAPGRLRGAARRSGRRRRRLR